MIALVDCGAHIGSSIKVLQFRRAFTSIYAFEPNPVLFPVLQANLSSLANLYELHLYDAAVWIHSTGVDLYLGHPESSTLIPGKRAHPRYGVPIDYQRPVHVKSIGLSQWIHATFGIGDTVILKMDIEGAEYEVLDQMLQEDTLRYIDELYVEWHVDRLLSISQDVHARIKREVANRTALRPWD